MLVDMLFDQGCSFLPVQKSVELLTNKLLRLITLRSASPRQETVGRLLAFACPAGAIYNFNGLALNILRVQPVRIASAAELSPLGTRKTAISTVSNGA